MFYKILNEKSGIPPPPTNANYIVAGLMINKM